jgi:sucrose phosphorylase
MATPAATAQPHDLRTLDALRGHLERLYPADVVEPLLARLWEAIERFRGTHPRLAVRSRHRFDESDVWLIAYGDQVRQAGVPPLETLRQFLDARAGGVVRGLHLLPHYPHTSDDGFAVVDYTEVDPLLGDWRDVERLGGSFRLMLDAVVNHTSASSSWFRSWLEGDERYRDFYLALEPGTDLTCVSRPRTSPLLSPFEGADGVRHVWTTFSPDQVDLNYANPEVLLTVTEILLGYVGRGASALRLDAIAFLWKDHRTSCMHLSETHEVIKLWRTVLDAVAPGTLVVTETNVPHVENISYFGDGSDEANIVYQFPLPPLVLYAFHLADTSVLQDWLRTLSTPSPSTTFLNFLGSHDGIGLRPVEGLLTPGEIQHLCDVVAAQGGGVTYRAMPDGSQSPYELNTVYFDALNPLDSVEPLDVQVDRFVASESILLALAGVPALYFNALFGSRNWHEGVEASGRLRVINRQKFALDALERELGDPGSLRHQVYERMMDRIAVRIAEPAFHPAGPQRVVASAPVFLAFEREAVDASSTVLCVHNVTGRPQTFEAGRAGGLTVRGTLVDLCDGSVWQTAVDGGLTVALGPFGVRWLRAAPG